MIREFSVVRVKKHVMSSWEFPLTADELDESPLAGPFSGSTMAELDLALGRFPFARRTGDGRRAWIISAPRRGQLEAWLTSDGGLYIEGETTLNLVFGLYVHLCDVLGDIVLEDRITGVMHNRTSLLRLVRRDEERRLPFDLDDDVLEPAFAL